MRFLTILLLSFFIFGSNSFSQEGPDYPIRIGLLLLENPDNDSTDLSAVHGIRLAIEQSNIPIKLMIRSCEGPWGVTSKQMVDFVYVDEVDAIITSVDGRNAHLAEQVATKVHKPLIAARATDPTLTQAYVPWFFKITADDYIQAMVIKNEIFESKKLERIAVIHPSSYNGTYSSQHFRDILDQKQLDRSLFISYDPLTNNFIPVLNKLQKQNPDAIVFLGKAKYSSKLIIGINEAYPEVALFANMEIVDNSAILSKMPDELFIPLPKENLSSAFLSDFRKKYGYQPGYVAAYAYDAIKLLISALKTHGTDFELLQKGISATNYTGVTGILKFDSQGNRISDIRLGQVNELFINSQE